MEMEKLLKRVHELEIEIQKLKAQLAPGGRQTVQVVKKSVGFVLTYWTLLSFVVAIVVAMYIKYSFNVDYFESYRALSSSRKISEFHSNLGDRLMLRQEWAAAEDAYTKALAANANNAAASYGLVKSRIWKPPPGEKILSPETQDTMLQFLRAEHPDDPELDFLQAIRYWTQSEGILARESLEKALQKNPRFSAAQMLLGHIDMSEGNMESAAVWCRKALESEPGNANAMGNLGFILMLLHEYAEAAELLEKSFRVSPSALVALVLSDVYRLSGDYATALGRSRMAVAMLDDEKVNDTRIAGGEWLYNYLPESKTDKETWKTGIYATTLPRKRAVALVANALDRALTGDLEGADKAVEQALKLEPAPEYREYLANKLRATVALGPVVEDGKVVAWITARLVGLAAPAEQ